MRYVVFLFALAACGGSDGSQKPPDGSTPKDAPKPIDSPPDAQAFVLKVDCATVTADAVVKTMNFLYVPATVTIPVDGVVRFELEAAHNVAPDTSKPTDPGLQVGFGATACLRFTKAGSFNFLCTPHEFKGTVTVN